MKKWLLIFCKPGQDRKAEINLFQQNFEVFRPTITTIKRRVGGKKILCTESMFPRYLFVQVEFGKTSISPISSTYGVAGLVKFGTNYAVASDELIDQLEKICELATISPKSMDDFQRSEAVIVNGHGFSDVKAIYCNPCGEERSMILIKILGDESKVEVPTSCLSRAI